MTGAFICPHCKTHNACTCTNCSKSITENDIPVGWTEDGEGMICGSCNKHFSPSQAMDEEMKEINREDLLQEVIKQVTEDLNGDGTVEALEELLRFIPIENQLAYLPERVSNRFKHSKF